MFIQSLQSGYVLDVANEQFNVGQPIYTWDKKRCDHFSSVTRADFNNDNQIFQLTSEGQITVSKHPDLVVSCDESGALTLRKAREYTSIEGLDQFWFFDMEKKLLCNQRFGTYLTEEKPKERLRALQLLNQDSPEGKKQQWSLELEVAR